VLVLKHLFLKQLKQGKSSSNSLCSETQSARTCWESFLHLVVFHHHQ